jgi:hypothetical protein
MIEMKATLRIGKVCFVKEVDDSPDLSWLGEFTDKEGDGWVVDRRRGEYVRVLEEAARVVCFKDAADAEDVNDTTDDPEQVTCSECRASLDLPPVEMEPYERPNRGRESRYFRPYAGGEPAGTDHYRTNGLQDWKRMEEYERGDWCSLFVQARAEVEVKIADRDFGVIQTVRSGGVGGCESDADASDFEGWKTDELADLREQLLALGLLEEEIARAFENVEDR